MTPRFPSPWLPLCCALALSSAGCSSNDHDPGTGSSSDELDSGTVNNGDPGDTEHFSFFVTSLKAMQELSGNPSGFGGDLRYGETGPGAGLRGADKICATIAERSMPGAGKKPWRAFLSASAGEDGQPVNAIDRIGEGPWYDRLGRLLAANKTDLANTRPLGGNAIIQNDFPNEDGIPNHQPDPSQPAVDNHDILTGSSATGMFYSATSTCKDWTAATGDKATEGRPRVGHSWPRSGAGGGGGFPRGDGGTFPTDGGRPPRGDGGMPPPGGRDGGFPPEGGDGGMGGGTGGGMGDMNNWMSSLDESGCAPGVNLVEMGGPIESSNTVGSGGGYGGIYCFSLVP
ncbi:hypothetical protein CYFUS_006827 [Cystobacter fuscus]|uniref:Lipoprotein n=1 Tax=Cystobacter fuscus TaxID=43 RepID=A0A250JD06_9BACT|nr:hypothetical protein [Cystobacter fuscus]ATB41362.1 hypothetical protein CYFUS_006827 [Cystobacter fuscus]